MIKNPTARKIAARIPKPKKKVTWPQARAFSVHVLTASGSFLAFLSIVAASEERWTAMFWWLGLALFVDGIDGPIARKLEVKEILRRAPPSLYIQIAPTPRSAAMPQAGRACPTHA